MEKKDLQLVCSDCDIEMVESKDKECHGKALMECPRCKGLAGTFKMLTNPLK